MVDMYYRLVKAGLRTIEKVPDQYRKAVMENFTASALSQYKTPTPNIDKGFK